VLLHHGNVDISFGKGSALGIKLEKGLNKRGGRRREGRSAKKDYIECVRVVKLDEEPDFYPHLGERGNAEKG